MAITKNEDIKVGEFVYKTLGSAHYGGREDNRRSLKLEITKVNSQFFTTEDGSKWTISKYARGDYKGNVRWTLRGGSYRSADADSMPSFPVVTLAELAKEAEEANARHAAEKEAKEAALKAKVATMDSNAIGSFIGETLKTGGYEEQRTLSDARKHMTPEQLEDYVTRLEYAVIEKQRQLVRAASAFRAHAERLNREAGNFDF